MYELVRAMTMDDLSHKMFEGLQAAQEHLENATKFLENVKKLVFEDAEKKTLGGIRFVEDRNQARAPRNMKLQFKNKISRVIVTGEEIRGQDKNPLQVILVDESSGNIVAVGPESSSTVAILPLKGSDGDDWTVEQFNKSIVRETGGMRPLLAGNQRIKLQNGIGFLENIKFRNHAIKMRPPRFELGARVIDTSHGVCIKEAKTESFDVKDYRYKYCRKHVTPSLSDEVFRLRNIGKNGKIAKRLQDHNIRNVKNFLIQHLMDPEGLKDIVNLGEKKWKITVEHALACSSDEKMAYYTNEHKMTGIVFDLSGQILGLYMERKYTPINVLSEKHKADAENLLESACKNWEKVEPFDFNEVGSHENAQTSEMNSPKTSQTGVGDWSFLDDMEINPNAFSADGPIYSSNLDVTPWNF